MAPAMGYSLPLLRSCAPSITYVLAKLKNRQIVGSASCARQQHRDAPLGIVNGALTTAGKVRFQTNDSAAPLAGGSATNFLSDPFSMKLGTLFLDRASVAFADESVQPRVVLGIEELSGTVKGLASDLSSPADVDLHGRVDVQSPFAVTGRVNPFAAALFVDLAITNANTQLTSLTGYLEKYWGVSAEEGPGKL